MLATIIAVHFEDHTEMRAPDLPFHAIIMMAQRLATKYKGEAHVELLRGELTEA